MTSSSVGFNSLEGNAVVDIAEAAKALWVVDTVDVAVSGVVTLSDIEETSVERSLYKKLVTLISEDKILINHQLSPVGVVLDIVLSFPVSVVSDVEGSGSAGIDPVISTIM